MSEMDVKDAICQLKFAVRHEEWSSVKDVIEYLQDFLEPEDLEEEE